MVNIDVWLRGFIDAVNATFGDRIWFIGLQGSYARGEATEDSDIDTVLILDDLAVSDIEMYNDMLDALPERNLICGFLAGKTEMLLWEPSDLLQFYYDTKPIQGNLDILLSRIDNTAVSKAIRTGACNIYHSCVHNMLYEKSEEILIGLLKAASFVVQTIVYKKTGIYCHQKAELLNIVTNDDREIIETFLALKSGTPICFPDVTEIIFQWSKKCITSECFL